jgi:acyl-CoA reductase-like NAD-dependent aldehyde dehydrogenase
VLSPHVRAARCSIQAARIVREAAEAAGAPPGLIQWVERPSLALAAALMRDPDINLILATGQQARLELVLAGVGAVADAVCVAMTQSIASADVRYLHF